MVDSHGRTIRDLRISITDRCNFRCVYCMEPDVRFAPRESLLTTDEIIRVARIANSLGVRKIRLTGGEPTLHPELTAIIAGIRAATDVEIAMITNASLLTREALRVWKAAGLARVTISIDSLRAGRFARLTRSTSSPADVLAGIEACLAEGLTPLKLNAGRNVVYYADKEHLVASGLIWPEGQDLLVRKAYLMHQPMGQGHVIGFAEDATYQLKRWDARAQEERVIEGFSARFAEAARTALGNIDVETTVLLDDDEKLIVQVVVTDLESNVTERVPIVVRKRIERRKLNKGQVAIATRTGSDGQTIYIVAATDDEVQMRLNSAQSKATRNAVLRLLRADIRQECWDQVVASQRMAAQQDGATAKYLARFRDLGVTEQQLAEFFGRENVGQLSPDELQELNGIGRAIRDGEATWAEIMESRGVSEPEAAESKPAADAKAKAPTEREQLIAKVREAAALKLIQWDDIQSQTVRLCGGNPPQAWEKLTSLQAQKLWQWLEHLAKTEATQGGATS